MEIYQDPNTKEWIAISDDGSSAAWGDTKEQAIEILTGKTPSADPIELQMEFEKGADEKEFEAVKYLTELGYTCIPPNKNLN